VHFSAALRTLDLHLITDFTDWSHVGLIKIFFPVYQMKTFICFSAQSLESQSSLTCNSSQVNGLRTRMNLAQRMTLLVLNVNLPCMMKLSLQFMAGMKCQWQRVLLLQSCHVSQCQNSSWNWHFITTTYNILMIRIKKYINKQGVDMAIPKIYVKLNFTRGNCFSFTSIAKT